MPYKLTLKSLADLDSAASLFLKHAAGHTVIALYGQMGAGKTTFTKALCKALGVKDAVQSPTFALVNEYTDGQGEPVYHFDFYRINRLEEAYDIGCDDYFYSGHLCLIEWPELVEPLLPEGSLRVAIVQHPDDSRTITIEQETED